jgi:hypothetical protein
MPFSYSNPQFCLPFTIPAGTIVIAFTDLSSVNVTVAEATRYTDRTGDPASDAWAYLAAELNADDSGANGTWTATEVSGGYQGLVKLACDRSGSGDGKTIQSVTFPSTTMSNLFGITTVNPSITVGSVSDQSFQGTQMGYGLWIAHTGADIFQALTEARTLDVGTATESPDMSATLLSFGQVKRRTVLMLSVPAAMVWDHYASSADSDWVDVYGGVQYDDQQAFDVFRRQWLGLADGQYCRYSEDATAPSTYVQLVPGAADGWIFDLSSAVEASLDGSYKFTLELTANEVA